MLFLENFYEDNRYVVKLIRFDFNTEEPYTFGFVIKDKQTGLYGVYDDTEIEIPIDEYGQGSFPGEVLSLVDVGHSLRIIYTFEVGARMSWYECEFEELLSKPSLNEEEMKKALDRLESEILGCETWNYMPKLSIRQSQRELTEDEKKLFEAIKCNDADEVKELLDMFELFDRNVDLNIQDNNGYTFLYYAAFRGYIAIVKLLLDHGADPNVKTAWSDTPLHTAARWGYVDIIKLLLEYGADPIIKNDKGRTPLDVARQENRTEVVKLLDEYMCPWDYMPKLSIKQGQRELTEDEKELFRAVAWKNKNKINKLLDQGFSPNIQDENGRTPLHYAVLWYPLQVDVIKLLLDRGADPNIQDSRGQTPLHIVAYEGHTIAAKLLLDYGADPSVTDNNGNTPEGLARVKGHFDVIELLSKHMYPWNYMPKLSIKQAQRELTKDEKELFRAVEDGDMDKVQELLDKGVSPGIQNEYGYTPLHYAAICDCVDAIRLLLDEGVDVDIRDEDGYTPLHYAAYWDSVDAAKTLLDRGANSDIRTRDGKRPVDIARESGYDDMIKLLDEYTYPWEDMPRLSIRRVQGLTEDEKELLEAIEDCENVDKVKELLDKGVNVNIKDRNGWAPLHYVTYWGCTAIAKLLLDHRADPNIRDEDGRTSLHRVAHSDSVEMTGLLLEYGADPNIKDKNGRTPLHAMISWYVVGWGGLDLIKLLLEYGADPNIKDNDGETPRDIAQEKGYDDIVKLLDEYTYPWDQLPKLSIRQSQRRRLTEDEKKLFEAVKNNQTGVIKELLDKGVDPNIQDRDGRTPLYLAAFGYIDVAKLLLDYGADPNIKTTWSETALHKAVYSGCMDMIKLLFRYGVDPNIKDEGGWTPLHLAAYKGRAGVVRLLLNMGVDLNVRDNRGQTPLHIAARGGCTKVVELLLSHGADPNIQDEDGWTPMEVARLHRHKDIIRLLDEYAHPWDFMPKLSIKQGQRELTEDEKELITAVKESNVDKVRELLDKGVDPNIQDEDGWTPLHIAALHDDINMVGLLLNYGADPNMQSENGQTPLHIAAYWAGVNVTELLLNHGADPGIKNDDGQTPKDKAFIGGRTDILRLLEKYRYPWDQLPKLSIKQGQRELTEDEKELFEVVKRDDVNKVKELLDRDIGLDIRDRNGWTPLHYAVLLHRTAVLKFLCNYKDGVNKIFNKELITFARARNDDDMVDLLKNFTTPWEGYDEFFN